MSYNHLKLEPDFSIYIPPGLEEHERANRIISLRAQLEGDELNPLNSLSRKTCPIAIYIDGRSLIDIVREVEKQVFAAENASRASDSEDDKTLTPGCYDWLTAQVIFPPSRNLLGDSFEEYIDGSPVVEAGDLHYGKSVLLGCPCSWSGCWFLVVKITFTPDTVIWSKFGQFWRETEYDMGPFVFDRKQYEAELKKYY